MFEIIYNFHFEQRILLYCFRWALELFLSEMRFLQCRRPFQSHVNGKIWDDPRRHLEIKTIMIIPGPGLRKIQYSAHTFRKIQHNKSGQWTSSSSKQFYAAWKEMTEGEAVFRKFRPGEKIMPAHLVFLYFNKVPGTRVKIIRTLKLENLSNSVKVSLWKTSMKLPTCSWRKCSGHENCD